MDWEKRRAEYSQKLKDPRWQKKRLEILQRDNWTCLECGDRDKTLHVHHLFYVEGVPWMTPDFGLRTLCEDCHESASRVSAGPEGIDQHFWSALVLMDVLARQGLNSSDVLDLAYRISETPHEEFSTIHRQFLTPSGPPPPSVEEQRLIDKASKDQQPE